MCWLVVITETHQSGQRRHFVLKTCRDASLTAFNNLWSTVRTLMPLMQSVVLIPVKANTSFLFSACRTLFTHKLPHRKRLSRHFIRRRVIFGSISSFYLHGHASYRQVPCSILCTATAAVLQHTHTHGHAHRHAHTSSKECKSVTALFGIMSEPGVRQSGECCAVASDTPLIRWRTRTRGCEVVFRAVRDRPGARFSHG